MGSLHVDGREIPLHEGDTVASAMYRAQIRVFNRSLKHHRPRGLYCGTGDCPNCLVTVDGVPGIRSCTEPAHDGMHIRREQGWPSTEFDLLRITDRMQELMPVGFYYKTFIKPRFAWETAEKVIRRATGVGTLPRDPTTSDEKPEALHMHTDVLVIGAGVAGLAAGAAAAGRGARVVVCDEGSIGAAVAPGPTLDRIRELEADLRALPGVTVLENHAAVGVYEGPMVPLVSRERLVQVHPGSVIVATGAAEAHGVFSGNDIPGVWLGRGAARMAGVHRVAPGRRAVVVVRTEEGLGHARTLAGSGVQVMVLADPPLAGGLPDGVKVLENAELVRAEGGKALTGVVVRQGGRERRIRCDALVLSLGHAPRDSLLRMAPTEPVVGAGDVILPGCSLEEAEASGKAAGLGEASTTEPRAAGTPHPHDDGYVCLCEDVGVKDLEKAWQEGYRSSEILKRYTTATMGPCQGAMCGQHLSCFARDHADVEDVPRAAARTTARPPARPATLETLAAAVHEVIEKHTALHRIHLASGAQMGRSGSWVRPFNYGDWREEYRAVRERVSVMDVGTLGKFLVAGRDGGALLDRIFPVRMKDLAPPHSRYMLALDEAGYVMDDGLICALDDGTHYLTSTSGGADRMEAWLRNWADRLELHAHIVNRTSELGSVLVAGPFARELLSLLCDDDISNEAFPYATSARITVSGIPCLALRVGFVGELAFELHHRRSQGPELWNALTEAGAPFGLMPHGLDALELLRLEKGHIYLGQDTLPDDTPYKLGLGFAVAMDKPDFVGRTALERISELPLERKLVGLEFAFGDSSLRGEPLQVGDRVVGRVTSCERSDSLNKVIGLGWLRAIDGAFPDRLTARGVAADVVPVPFYDPEGVSLRA